MMRSPMQPMMRVMLASTARQASSPVETPRAFEAGDWSVADEESGGTLTVTISDLPDDRGQTISAIQYRVDGGAWTASGLDDTGTFDIEDLTDDQEYTVQLRAVNAAGAGPASDAKTATPTQA